MRLNGGLAACPPGIEGATDFGDTVSKETSKSFVDHSDVSNAYSEEIEETYNGSTLFPVLVK